jgi:hypothetical protein
LWRGANLHSAFLLNWKPTRSIGARLSLEQYFRFVRANEVRCFE